jgi:hypothetical protein
VNSSKIKGNYKKTVYYAMEKMQKIGACIICENGISKTSKEHIIPESLGNKD